MKTSIIIPTMYRWKRLKKTLKEIKKNTLVPYEIIIVCDEDMETFNNLKKMKTKHKVIFNPKPMKYIFCINQGCFISEGDYIVNFSDDAMPKKGWLKGAIGLFEKHFKDRLGIIHLQDDAFKDVASFALMSRELLISRGGDFYSPAYTHWYGDSELHVRMVDLGRCGITKDVVIHHENRKLNKKLHDKVYEDNDKYWPDDEITFLKRNRELLNVMFSFKKMANIYHK